MSRKVRKFLAMMTAVVLLLGGCDQGQILQDASRIEQDEKLQIGLSWDTFVLERWMRDRDVFVSTATELGAEVNVQNANGSLDEQLSQIRYLIDKNMDVIVIVAVDCNNQELVGLVKEAKRKGIKVISYDRLICDAGTDLYLSFDNEKVGELAAQAVLDQIPEGGKIAAIFGSPTDHNVTEVERGVNRVLQANNQELIYKEYAINWAAEYAQLYTNKWLDEGPVDALICGNDGLAAAAYNVLAERQLAGKVCLTGQDADIDACQRIVEGVQYMTVYKSITDLAKQAAQYAVALGNDKEINPQDSMNDGTYEVPFYKLEPVAVTKENIDEVIIGSQFHFRDEVYLHVEE